MNWDTAIKHRKNWKCFWFGHKLFSAQDSGVWVSVCKRCPKVFVKP